MKKLATVGAMILSAGCTTLVPHEQSAVMDDRFIDRLVQSCPTGQPLVTRARVTEFQAADASYSRDSLLRYVDACPGLSAEQQLGYWHLINAAARERHETYQTAATTERRRRAEGVRRAGDTIMAIERTQDLSKIRRNGEDW